MKKIFYTLALAGLFLSVSTAGHKSNPISCAAELAKVSAAASKYAADDNSENCKAYQAAIQSYLNSCGSSLSAEQKAEFQATIDGMNCP